MTNLIINGGSQTLDGIHTYDRIDITNGGTLFITPYNGTGTTGTLILNITEINVDSTSSINGFARGYTGGAGGYSGYISGNIDTRCSNSSRGKKGTGPGAGVDGEYSWNSQNCTSSGNHGGGGGGGSGYGTIGGSGGNAINTTTNIGHGGAGGVIQGTIDELDIAMGSGAGGAGVSVRSSGTQVTGGAGNPGGGMLTINATSDVTIHGTVDLRGGTGGSTPSEMYKGGGGGGASGGGLLIEAQNVDISGSILTTLGGAGGTGYTSGGSGGGGRIKIFYSGTYNNTGATISSGTTYIQYNVPITGNLTITSAPSGARIYIDNVDQEIDTPNTISALTPGSHDVKLSLTNYNDYTTTVTIISNQTITITPTLTLSTGMTKVQASPSFVQPSFSGEMIDVGTLKFSWNGTGTVILEKTIVYDRLVLTGPNGIFDHTWTPCGAIVPEGPFNITSIFSPGYNETNVKIYNVCGGNIGTETGSIDITGPIVLTCPITPKYSGDTITLQATPKDGIGPYYIEFSKDGVPTDPVRLGGLNPIYNVSENTTITRTYTLTDEDVRNALTGTITFSVFMSDSCPTEAKTCTQECIINIGCIPPVCNFTVV